MGRPLCCNTDQRFCRCTRTALSPPPPCELIGEAYVRHPSACFVLKPVDAHELIAAIAAVQRGDYLIDPIIASRVLSELHLGMPESPRIEPLTEGEMALLRLVAQGVDNHEIAQALGYSVYTVANRLRTIYEKLHVTNRSQAALYALRQGWAALDEPPG